MNGKLRIMLCSSLLILNSIIPFQNAHPEKKSSVIFAGVDTLVDKAIDLVYSKQYDDAIKMCEEVIQKYPDNPMGYLGEAAVYHFIMLNYRVSTFDSTYEHLTTLAIKHGERTIQKHEDDAYAYFVLGAAYGFRGLNRIRKGQWFGAFKDGLKGVSNIKQAHSHDKTLYDTYFGLGLYYYWKSAKAKVLTFLRLMKDERNKGIEYLKIAIDKGRFSSQEAVFALIEIYYYEDRYEDAFNLCLSLKSRFVDDPTWNYLIAKTAEKLNRSEEAMNYFSKLLALLEESPFKANSFLAECHHGIANACFELAQYDRARQELDSAFDFSRRWDKAKEIEGPLLDIDKVLDRMKILDQELKKTSEHEN